MNMEPIRPDSSFTLYTSSSEPGFDSTSDAGETDESSRAGDAGEAHSDVRVGHKQEKGESSDQGHSGIAEPTLDAPANDSDYKAGSDIMMIIAMKILELVEDIMQRRIDRAKLSKEISSLLKETAFEESDKAKEQAREALKKKNTGIWGKVFSAGMLVLSVALVFTGVGGVLGSIMLATTVASTIDTFANDGKVMARLMEETVGRAVKLVAKGLEELGVSKEAANYIAFAVVIIPLIVATALFTKMTASKSTVTLADDAAEKAGAALALATNAGNAAKTARAAGNFDKANKLMAQAQKSFEVTSTQAKNLLEGAKVAQAKSVKLAQAAEKAAKVGDMKKAERLLIDSQKAADIAFKHAKYAQEISAATQKSLNGMGLSQNSDEYLELANTARQIQEAADEAVKASKNAHEAVTRARIAVQGEKASTEFYKARDVGEAHADIANGKVYPLNDGPADNILASTQDPYGGLRAALQIAQVFTNTGSTIHQETINIINAQIDYLMAQDEADIKELKSLMALLQTVLDGMNTIEEGDKTLVQSLLDDTLRRFMGETLPSVYQPLFSNRA